MQAKNFDKPEELNSSVMEIQRGETQNPLFADRKMCPIGKLVSDAVLQMKLEKDDETMPVFNTVLRQLFSCVKMESKRLSIRKRNKKETLKAFSVARSKHRSRSSSLR